MTAEKLGNLLRLLQISPADLKEEEAFGLKMRVQHVVYLLQYMGEGGFDYAFTAYFRGPYSVELARACSFLTRADQGRIERAELATWFFDNELEWLSAATTIMMIHTSYAGRRNEEFGAVRFYREHLTEEEFESVLSELKGRGVLAD